MIVTTEPPEPRADRPLATVAVRTSSLTRRYGDRVAVESLSFALPTGAVTGFIGPNGAGKTTTIRMLLGLIRPSGGSAEMLGAPITHPDAYLARVGALIEGPAFYPYLSGRANLRVLARLGGFAEDRIDAVLAQVDLADRADDPARSYSLGMKQRLGVAAALLADPDLLVLDEPTNGLDPAGIREMRSLLRGVADAGRTVFVSSHLLDELQQICDHLVMIDKGRLVFEGSVAEFLEHRRPELRAVPERAEQIGALVELCTAAGFAARAVGDEVHVTAPGSWAAELNRSAMSAGITLRALGAGEVRLEEAFLAITEGDRP